MKLKKQSEWRPIPGWDRYEVSSDGQIRCVDSGRILKPGTTNHGHKYVFLFPGKTCLYVHRLVMLAFVGASDLNVLHGKGGPGDNRLSNLRYGTQSENILEAQHPAQRMVRREDGVVYTRVQEAARDNGVPAGNIVHCCKGRRQTAGGFTWEYVDDEDNN